MLSVTGALQKEEVEVESIHESAFFLRLLASQIHDNPDRRHPRGEDRKRTKKSSARLHIIAVSPRTMGLGRLNRDEKSRRFYLNTPPLPRKRARFLGRNFMQMIYNQLLEQ